MEVKSFFRLMKILLVDDDTAVLEYTHTFLKDMGHEVLCAKDGHNCIKLFQTNNDLDLIILDVIMPIMSGYEVAKYIRTKSEKWIPIIFISSKNGARDIICAINAGGDDYIIKPVIPEVLNAKIKSLNRINEIKKALVEKTQELEKAQKEIMSANNKLKRINKQKTYQANHDFLTGLANRALFITLLEKEIEISKRTQKKIAVMFIDLDGFKAINDTLGHKEGDNLLKEVAKKIKNSIRKSDTASRFGGDEFVILLNNIDTHNTAAKIANILISCINQTIKYDHIEEFVSASVGIAMWPEDGDKADTIINNADSAMYNAKQQGKNNYQFYSHNLDIKAHKYNAYIQKIKKGIRNNEFDLFYQPQIDFKKREIISAEALIRWIHPEDGIIYPLDFIPIAEDTGLISIIDRLVFLKICDMFLDSQLDDNFTVAFNVSSRDLNNKAFTESIKEVASTNPKIAKKIQLELTESIFEKDIKHISKILHDLKRYGLTLALDDFGTGYSSLSYLNELPIDLIKIDKSFIQGITNDDKKQILVKTIISMAYNLDINVLAEGVETIEQAELLYSEGCNLMQGYLFAKPLPIDQLFNQIREFKCISS